MAYVYVHLTADSGEPFYVGMGKTSSRIWDMNKRSAFHKNIVAKHGVRAWGIGYNLTWEAAQRWEMCWIRALKEAGYKLANHTDGGEGVNGLIMSDISRAKMAAAKIGKKQPPDVIAKRIAPLIGRKQPIDAIKRGAEKRRGRPFTEEHKAKLSAAKKGKKLGPEMLAKMSAARKGKPWSDARRAAYNASKEIREEQK